MHLCHSANHRWSEYILGYKKTVPQTGYQVRFPILLCKMYHAGKKLNQWEFIYPVGTLDNLGGSLDSFIVAVIKLVWCYDLHFLI